MPSGNASTIASGLRAWNSEQIPLDGIKYLLFHFFSFQIDQ